MCLEYALSGTCILALALYKRRLGLVLLLVASSGMLVSGPSNAERGRPVLIGALNASWGATPQVVGLRDRLRELGYRENEDFVIGVRFTQGDIAALAGAARQLVAEGVDIILVDHDDAARAARDATDRIPIVCTGLSDPVELGLIRSFAQPGGNLTGIADLHFELGPKRLEIFRAMLPGMKRILFLYATTDANAAAEAKALNETARRLGVKFVVHAVSTEAQARAALIGLRGKKIDGILVPRCCALNLPAIIFEATTEQRLPMMYESTFWAERGALASYGPDIYASGRMAARLIDKIINGASPAEIPVEVNRDVEFVINLTTARLLGLKLAPEVTYRANRFVH